MARTRTIQPGWENPFIEALGRSGVVARAAREAGVSETTPYKRRNTCPVFAKRWDEAKAGAIAARGGGGTPGPMGKPTLRKWRQAFLVALAETSNVSAAARRVNVPPSEAYAARRTDRAFADAWQAALYEGYRNLEMEVLGHLRDPDPQRKMDVANALRLLGAHRETAAREGAKRSHVSAAEVRASIDRKVEALRKQVAARQRAERGNPDGTCGDGKPR